MVEPIYNIIEDAPPAGECVGEGVHLHGAILWPACKICHRAAALGDAPQPFPCSVDDPTLVAPIDPRDRLAALGHARWSPTRQRDCFDMSVESAATPEVGDPRAVGRERGLPRVVGARNGHRVGFPEATDVEGAPEEEIGPGDRLSVPP